MKVSLFIVLLFTVTISWCGGKPPEHKRLKSGIESMPFLNKEHVDHSDEEKTTLTRKLKHPPLLKSAMKHANQPKNFNKTVSFNEQVLVCPKSSSYSNESGIFWLSYKEFSPIIFEKCQMFDENSVESEFVALMQEFVERNYGMFEVLYQSAAKFSNYDSYLWQIEKEINGKTILFPSSTDFMQIKSVTNDFEKSIIKLLDAIIPAYELNEHLLNLMKSVNEKTKIDPSFMENLHQEDEKIVSIFDSFRRIFETLSLDGYMQGLSEIRKTTNHLEFDDIDLDEANECFDKSSPKLNGNAPKIKDALTLAHLIDYKILREATKAFYDYVRKSLKVDGPSSSE